MFKVLLSGALLLALAWNGAGSPLLSMNEPVVKAFRHGMVSVVD